MADIVTDAGFGTAPGAVYIPLASMVPADALPPEMPFTCQATCVLVVPVTLAVNGCCCVGNRLAVFGVTFTRTDEPPPPPPPPAPPPQELSTNAQTSKITTPTPFTRAVLRRLNPPIAMPTAKVHTKNGTWCSFCATGRSAARLGPRVVMFRLAVCVPFAPAVTCGFEQLAPAGNPLHEKVTGLGNVVDPTGVTVKL
jgi:hypothetical protein